MTMKDYFNLSIVLISAIILLVSSYDLIIFGGYYVKNMKSHNDKELLVLGTKVMLPLLSFAMAFIVIANFFEYSLIFMIIGGSVLSSFAMLLVTKRKYLSAVLLSCSLTQLFLLLL